MAEMPELLKTEMKLHFVEQMDEVLQIALEEKLPEAHDALRPETAATMANILRGVVLRGTAQRASSLGRPLCGKTGTTDNWSDTWFVGFERDDRQHECDPEDN